MESISVIQQASEEYIQIAGRKHNLPQKVIDAFDHPQEDYLEISEKRPAFAIADGVTLDVEELAESQIQYPDPSPSGRVAQIFCESVIRFCNEAYDSFTKGDLKRVFAAANDQVASYNKTINRKELVNNPTGQFAATGAFVVIKNGTAFWLSICDSFVAHFDSDMNKKFMSSGGCDPYAVINGECRMVDEIEAGERSVADGDRLFLLTDGFEHYFYHDDFLSIFQNWDDNVAAKVNTVAKDLAAENPDKYGHERSMIAVRVN